MKTIELQPRQEQHLDRWRELAADPYLADLPFKIETDRFGRILVSPPPFSNHILFVASIIELLHAHAPNGKALADTPVVTSDGIKVTDAAWIPSRYAQELKGQDLPALTQAPEICVEVLSPSNTQEEMDEKRALYFEAGAKEVWICGRDGTILFYTPEFSPGGSKLCPAFPIRI